MRKTAFFLLLIVVATFCGLGCQTAETKAPVPEGTPLSTPKPGAEGTKAGAQAVTAPALEVNTNAPSKVGTKVGGGSTAQ